MRRTKLWIGVWVAVGLAVSAFWAPAGQKDDRSHSDDKDNPRPRFENQAGPAKANAPKRVTLNESPFAIWDGTTDPRSMDYLGELKPATSVMVVPPLFFDKQSVEAGWPHHRRIYREHVRLGIEFIPVNDLEHGGIDMSLAELDAAVRMAVKTFPEMKTILIGCEADGGCGPKVSRRPRDYALRVRVAYRAVKAVRPFCRVAVGGTGGNAKSYSRRPQQGVLGNPLSNPGYFDAVFAELERLEAFEKDPESYDWKANSLGLTKEQFKLVFSPDAYEKYQDIHHISLFVSDHRKYRDAQHLGVVRAVKALLYDYGYRDTEIWITQAGTHSGTIKSKFLGGPPQTEREQAASLIKQYLVYRSWGVKKIFWTSTLEFDWPEDFGAPLGAPGNPQHYFSLVGLIHNGKGEGDPGHGLRKLAFHTYRRLVEELGRADWDRLELVRDDDAVVFRLWVDGKPVYVAWREPTTPGPFRPVPPLFGQGAQGPVSVRLAIGGKAASVTSLIPAAKEGEDIRNGRIIFPSRRIETSGGRVQIELSEEPVLIY